MRDYAVPMVPGPTTVPKAVLDRYQFDFGSADLEEEYFSLYASVERQLGEILATRNRLAIMTGEGMVALWGALNSSLRPGDRVLSVATGVFGRGIGDMARSVGAAVETVDFADDEAADPSIVEAAIERFGPKMVTMVHCETPSGTLNPVGAVGDLIARHGVPLFYVDAVSSAAGCPVLTDQWNIDLCLVGSQKCLSIPPSMSVVSVSERAWEVIADVGYQGYDALLPWRTALADRYFPYTPYWHGLAMLDESCQRILSEGLPNVFARHRRVAERCRAGVRALGLELFPKEESFCAPTVTAVKVPEGKDWTRMNSDLRRRGVVIGGNWGTLANKVFRIGHMGTQADDELLGKTLAALSEVLG
jgi:aspartate aminotransferase-like enzyme